MTRTRVIPLLLIEKGKLVKTVQFKKAKYVGDPINAVKIFNEKEIDEIIILDITATVEKRAPDIQMITDLAGECFMPFCYGGGITTIEDMKRIFYAGSEKICINTAAVQNPALISEAARLFGNQSIVVSIDVKKNIWGKYQVFTQRGTKNTGIDPIRFAVEMESSGAGEIFLNSIEKDGTFSGYDLELTEQVSNAIKIPVIAGGGAGKVEDLADAVRFGASAVAAGSMFVFQGTHRAVLINFPSQEVLKEKLYSIS